MNAREDLGLDLYEALPPFLQTSDDEFDWDQEDEGWVTTRALALKPHSRSYRTTSRILREMLKWEIVERRPCGTQAEWRLTRTGIQQLAAVGLL